jgi:hypothetical protein
VLVPPKPGVTADPRAAAANDGTMISVSSTSHEIHGRADGMIGRRSVLQYAFAETSVQVPFRRV